MKEITQKWTPSLYNFVDEVRAAMPNLPKSVIICDSTLREGEETPGVYMSQEDKLRIARKLDEMGVKEAEFGYPGAIREHAEIVKMIGKEGLRLKKAGFVRVYTEDWKKDADIGIDSGLDRVLVLTPISDIQIKIRFPVSVEENIKRSVEAIEYCKGRGVGITFAPWDTTRAPYERLEKTYKAGVKAGADRVLIYDTLGVTFPASIRYLVSKIKSLVGPKVGIHFHVHNDFGMATAVTLAAFEGGAESADCVFNGLGDRAGNAPFEEVAAACEMLYGIKTGLKLEMLFEVSKLVQEITKVKAQPNKPIVGTNVFIHTSDIHVHGILSGLWYTYEPYLPEVVGQKRLLFFGPTSLHGDSIKSKMETMGLKPTDKQLNTIMEETREIIKKKNYATEKEVEELARKIIK